MCLKKRETMYITEEKTTWSIQVTFVKARALLYRNTVVSFIYQARI